MKYPTRLAFTTGVVIAAISAIAASSVSAPLPAAGAGSTDCSSDRFPQAKTQVQCCQDGNSTWHNDGSGHLVYRTYGTPCREENGTGIDCGVGSPSGKQCVYGACGAKNEILISAKIVQVFKSKAPASLLNVPTQTAKCGFAALHIINIPACSTPGCVHIGGEVSFVPPGNNTGLVLAPGVQGTCTFTKCDHGIPQ